MVWSFVGLVARRGVSLVVLRVRSWESKEIEILVLRRQQPRPRFEPTDRAWLALLSRLQPGNALR